MFKFTKSPLVTTPLTFNSKRIEKEDNQVKEQWKTLVIDGNPTLYQISTYGEVFNIHTQKKVQPHEKLQKNRNTLYLAVHIVDLFGNRIYKTIHRLVAMTFIPIPSKYKKLGLSFKDLEVNHKDGNKWHNVVSNLEWVTHDENILHAKENGLYNSVKGEKHPATNFTEKEIRHICELLQSGKYPTEISKMLNVSKRFVQHIKAGETWTSISKDYTFPKKPGSRRPNDISDETIHKICKILQDRAEGKNKFSEQTISEMCGVSRAYVNLVLIGKIRTNISKNYKF